jgi:SAM-dependent methyltransferase
LSRVAFTGERLDDDHVLFAADLARHRAAYRFALESARGARVLDLGCGTGYGSAELADVASSVVALDRIAPAGEFRRRSLRYVRADLHRIPLAPSTFDLVVSFQVIEHLDDPTDYLEAIAALMAPGATALLTTPNLLQSDRQNPFHVHEYEAAELRERLERHFGSVEMRGVGASPRAARYHEARLRRIRLIVSLDPLKIRDLLPRRLVEWLFARLAVLVRRGIQKTGGLPELTVDDFPIGAADERCLDLLAICRDPRGGASRRSR